MNKLIQVAIGCLALCGTLAVLPGIAQAREPERAPAAHVERGAHGRDAGREHGRDRAGHERGRDRGRFERGCGDGRRVGR